MSKIKEIIFPLLLIFMGVMLHFVNDVSLRIRTIGSDVRVLHQFLTNQPTDSDALVIKAATAVERLNAAGWLVHQVFLAILIAIILGTLAYLCLTQTPAYRKIMFSLAMLGLCFWASFVTLD